MAICEALSLPRTCNCQSELKKQHIAKRNAKERRRERRDYFSLLIMGLYTTIICKTSCN
jgi:hypothetical protein